MSKQQPTPSQKMEEMRLIVVEQELSARSWRAMLSKMQDTIEVHKLQEEYSQVMEAMQVRQREEAESAALIQNAISQSLQDSNATVENG